MTDLITARHYAGLTLTTVAFSAETHVSGIPGALSRGVRVLLAAPGRTP